VTLAVVLAAMFSCRHADDLSCVLWGVLVCVVCVGSAVGCVAGYIPQYLQWQQG